MPTKHLNKTNQSERIAIIGSSMSGKTYYLCTEIVPCFQYIHYFGPEHNMPVLMECLNPRALLKHHTNSLGVVDIMDIAKYQHDHDNPLPPQLIIFDDFIDTQFIKTDICKRLFAMGRHYNLSIVMIAHTPNLVITPYIKAQMTAIVLCEYSPTDGFKDLIDTYFKPMLMSDLDTVSHSDRELNKLVNDHLNSIFKYKYGKLILRPQDSTWSAYFPEQKIEKSSSYREVPVCSINRVRRSANKDKAFLGEPTETVERLL